jgi:hypothetical protein
MGDLLTSRQIADNLKKEKELVSQKSFLRDLAKKLKEELNRYNQTKKRKRSKDEIQVDLKKLQSNMKQLDRIRSVNSARYSITNEAGEEERIGRAVKTLRGFNGEEFVTFVNNIFDEEDELDEVVNRRFLINDVPRFKIVDDVVDETDYDVDDDSEDEFGRIAFGGKNPRKSKAKKSKKRTQRRTRRMKGRLPKNFSAPSNKGPK